MARLSVLVNTRLLSTASFMSTMPHTVGGLKRVNLPWITASALRFDAFGYFAA
jgi:hypothetical protein